MNIVLRPWRHFFDFEGRSRRTEFALFYLVYWGIVGGLAAVIRAFEPGRLDSATPQAAGGLILIPMLFLLAGLIPSLALSVRRLHDQNKTGLALLLMVIPGVNVIMFFILLLGGGTTGPNSYGDDPREEAWAQETA
jgi:uncharacterized membrane protein YhaH (DUF805 family)